MISLFFQKYEAKANQPSSSSDYKTIIVLLKKFIKPKWLQYNLKYPGPKIIKMTVKGVNHINDSVITKERHNIAETSFSASPVKRRH